MSEIIMSLSSDSDEREIDEYHDKSNSSGSSDNGSNSSNSSRGNTTDKQYLSRVPRVPLEVLQEVMRTRMASGSLVGTSTGAPSSASSSKEETLYFCAVGIPSRTDEKKLNSLRSLY